MVVRKQLRPFYTPEELAEVYSYQYDSSRWEDHRLRVNYTADVLRIMAPRNVADLSCGDGEIVNQAGLLANSIMGDYTFGWDYQGRIESTITWMESVDVFLLSETLEHVEDPDWLLRMIRTKAKRLLMSTPCGEDNSNNPQHYWGWDNHDIDAMLKAAGWHHRVVALFKPPPGYYTYQIWMCA
jgi:hypothetical protein